MFPLYYKKVVELLLVLVPGPSGYDFFSVASLAAGQSLAYAHSAVIFPFSALCVPPFAPQRLSVAISAAPTVVSAGYVVILAAVGMIEGGHASNTGSAAMVVVSVLAAVGHLPAKDAVVDFGFAILAVDALMVAVVFVFHHISEVAHLLATSPVAFVAASAAADHLATNVAAGPSALQEEP